MSTTTLQADLSGLSRIPTSPPKITPVPEGVPRPLWSVMIPAYNCISYLQGTIESVLEQAPDPDLMQIIVVDDCSTDGDVSAMVKKVGRGRVCCFIQGKNVGSLRNFETCLNLSLGHWVHILHGDDKVVKGFYQEIETLFRNYTNASAAFTESAYIIQSQKGEELHKFPGLAPETCILENFLQKTAEGIKLQPPSIVVKREVYERLGGFYAVHYGEDWEMWARIAANYSVAYSPKVLAHYRYIGGASITQHSIANGQNIRDIIKVIDIIQNYLPLNQRSRLRRKGRFNYAMYCASLANSLLRTNPAAAIIQAEGALSMSKDIRVCIALAKFFFRNLLHFPK